MNLRRSAAKLFALLAVLVVLFQFALALGAPWGGYAMGGAFAGRLPPALRVAAVIQGLLILGFAAIVLARAGLVWRPLARRSVRGIWVVVAFCAVASVLNLITPSADERALWAPVALLLFATSLVVATGPLNCARPGDPPDPK
jgi:uncharacterized membrane protein YhaH (DUF805 family)